MTNDAKKFLDGFEGMTNEEIRTTIDLVSMNDDMSFDEAVKKVKKERKNKYNV